MANAVAEKVGDPVAGLTLVIGVKDSAGNVKILELNAAGQLPVSVDNGAITLSPTNLSTSALQTSIGATAHTDSGDEQEAILDVEEQVLALTTANHTDLAAILAAQATLLAAVKPFVTFVPIDYSGGDQTVATVGGLTMRGFNITTAGLLYVDCASVTNGPFAVGVGTNLLAAVTKIYQTSSTAAGSIVY